MGKEGRQGNRARNSTKGFEAPSFPLDSKENQGVKVKNSFKLSSWVSIVVGQGQHKDEGW